MKLDTNTLNLVGLITALYLPLVMLMLARNNSVEPHIRDWVTGALAYATGFLCLALRGWAPDLISIVLGNTLAVFGYCRFTIGLRRFFGMGATRAWDWAVTAFTALTFSYLTFVTPAPVTRIIIFSWLIAGLYCVLATTVGRARLPPAELPSSLRYAFVAVVSVSAGVAVVRGAGFLLRDTFQITDDPSSLIYNSSYLLGIITNMGLCVFTPLLVLLRHQAVLAQDLAKRRQAERELIKSEARSRTLIEHAPYCIHEIDRAGQLTSMNPAGLKMMGVDDECAIQGLSYLAAVSDSDRPRIAALLAAALAGQKSEFSFQGNGGQSYQSGFVPIIDDQGVVLRLMGISIDITAAKAAEAQLLQYRDHLEEQVEKRTAELVIARDVAQSSSKAKSVFLANMSHELRTPINGVMGMIALAKRLATDPKQIDYLKKSEQSSRHLLAVISDILDLSKIEANRLTLEQQNFSIAFVIDSSIEMLTEAAERKNLQLIRDIDAQVPDLLHGDGLRLKQCLLNFVGNAIKFSDHGKITVCVTLDETDAESVLLRLAVTDQGIGLSLDEQARLFLAFVQADDSTSRKYGGTGLGLIISKQIAVLMGGDAGVSSEPGLGSTFWITARLQRALEHLNEFAHAEIDAKAELQTRFSGSRILLVEDEPFNQEIAQCMLEDAGLIVDVANDGEEALAMVGATDYALILMDMQMPRMGGLEATRLIRRMPNVDQIPILAMTANAFAEDRRAALESGMNDFITKPVPSDVLYAAALHWLQHLETSSPN